LYQLQKKAEKRIFASFLVSPGTLASSTTKTGRHDIAEILLKVALNTKNQSVNQYLLNNIKAYTFFYR
jgi:hypothetical protein